MCIRDSTTSAQLPVIAITELLTTNRTEPTGTTPVSYTHLDVYKRQMRIPVRRDGRLNVNKIKPSFDVVFVTVSHWDFHIYAAVLTIHVI